MLTWPHEDTDWAPYLAEVEPVYIEVARQVLQRQSLLIICHNEALKHRVHSLLQRSNIDISRLHTFIIPCDDTWARDHGPITLVDDQGNNKALDFIFNGWGNKYDATADNAINRYLLQQTSVQAEYQAVDFVLEGGGIEVDGQGHLLTTEQCLLNQNRNPGLTRKQIEQQLNQHFGCEQVLWLQHGSLEGDDTDSHIDTLARFAPDNTIVYVQCHDQNDAHFDELHRMEQELTSLRRHDGKAFNLVPLPMPAACFNQQGERLPATYANFLIINDAVLVPTYRQPELDNRALQQVQTAFPQYDIIAVDCLPLIEQFGSLHCITMQLPKGFLA